MNLIEAIKAIEETGLYRVVPKKDDREPLSALLTEMANKWKSHTGLPMNIWIDERQTYKLGKHSKRIKFQLDTSTKLHPDNQASMDLNGIVHNYDEARSELSERDIRDLRNWVWNNAIALDLVADMRLPLDDIFPYMIKGTELASEEQLKELAKRCEELKIE